MQREPTYVGIDVAKEMLDVALRPAGERWRVAHDAAGLEQLVARLQALAAAPALIVLEATGGLELGLVGALAAAALPVVVVNPRQVRDFARATGPAGQDRRPRRGRPGALRGGRAAAAASRSATPRAWRCKAAARAADDSWSTMLVAEAQPSLARATAAVRPRDRGPHRVAGASSCSELEDELRQTAAAAVPSGVSVTQLLRSGPRAWASSSHSRCWPSCRSWARLEPPRRSPPWSALRPSTATAAGGAADARSGAGAPGCAPCSTWARSAPAATTR